MIAIIDYDMGNLRSVQKAFERVGAEAKITRDPEVIRVASHVVLPGVGAFANCMANLKKYKLIDPIKETIDQKKPFLGICLGLQLLFQEGEEFGTHEGLGIFPGKVIRFKLPKKLKVPHMGWNRIHKSKKGTLVEELEDGTYTYFVHSYHVVPEDNGLIATTTHYGKMFVSSIAKGNLFACQFHPEKSQTAGLKILKAFTIKN